MNERERSSQLTLESAEQIADAMQALSTPSRVRILAALRDGPVAVGELAQSVEMEQSAVSHQLRILRHMGLVVGSRNGRQVIYALHDSHVASLLEEAISHTEHRRLGISNSG